MLRYRALLRFVAKEGHAGVSKTHVEGGLRVGTWVQHQRALYRKERLTAEQVSLLGRLPGWEWHVRAARGSFNEMMRLLSEYVRRHGHARVPGTHREKGLPLGAWVQYVRYCYRRDRLSAERAAALERVKGWRWRVAPPRSSFDAMLRLLKKYARREGHARVPMDHVESGMRLGGWVSRQRVRYGLGLLSGSQRAQLEAVRGWAWRLTRRPARLTFDQAHELLVRFVKREGHARVPQAHREAGVPLGTWLTERRCAFRRGQLPPDQVRRLERVPSWTWEPRRQDYEEKLALLRRFVKREGHARVPQSHCEGGIHLGWWVSSRRTAFERGLVGKEEAAVLESLPGWTWSASLESDRALMLRALSQFVRREGHAHLPAEHIERGLRLGRWVSRQRAAFPRGRLSPPLARRLERLPGWTWDPRQDRHRHMVALLRRFVEREGHARVPQRHVEAGENLGAWLYSRRRDFRAGRMSRELRAALEPVRGWTRRAPRGQDPPRLARRGGGRVQRAAVGRSDRPMEAFGYLRART